MNRILVVDDEPKVTEAVGRYTCGRPAGAPPSPKDALDAVTAAPLHDIGTVS